MRVSVLPDRVTTRTKCRMNAPDGGESLGHSRPRSLGGILLSTYQTPTANGPSTTTGAPPDSTAQQAKEQAKDKAQQAAGQARRGLRDQVDQRSTQAGERVGGMAQDVRDVAGQLREQGKDQPAKLAEQAAQRADSIGDYLKRSDGDTILGDIEDLGRRQPWAVIAGGLMLGFAASRFLKASSSRRYESRWESSNRLPARRQDVSPPPVAPRAPLAGDELSTGNLGGGPLDR
jgi:hypothetical protein